MEWRLATDRPFTWRLMASDEQLLAELLWIEDVHDRAGAGWWLRSPLLPAAGPLDVDARIEALGRDRDSSARAWITRAEAVALLTAPSAMALVESRFIDDGTLRPDGPPPSDGRRRYRLYVEGMDARQLGCAFPELATEQAGAMAVLSGVLDDDTLDRTLSRIRELGCTVGGCITVPS